MTPGAGRTRGLRLNVLAGKDKRTGAEGLGRTNLFFPYFKAFCVASRAVITLEVFQTRSDTGKIALPDNGSPQLCLINYVVGHETGFFSYKNFKANPLCPG